MVLPVLLLLGCFGFVPAVLALGQLPLGAMQGGLPPGGAMVLSGTAPMWPSL